MPPPPSNRAIVLGITPGLDFAAGALIAALMRQEPDFSGAIVVLHNGLSEPQQAALSRLAPEVRFGVFDEPALMARLGMGIVPQLADLLARFSPLFLAKLTLPDMLDDFAKVLWLDADMLIRKPLGPVWSFDCLTWRPLPQGAFARRARVLAAFDDLPRAASVPLLNGGLVGVGQRFRDHATSADLFALARRILTGCKTDQVDELAFYLLAASRGMAVHPQPLAYNHPVGMAGAAGAAILHAIGPHKFWNATPLIGGCPDWQAHQATYVAAGGRAYDGPLLLDDEYPLGLDRALRSAELRAFWAGVYAVLRPALPPGILPDLATGRPYLRLFLRGRPDSQHIRLTRQTNPDRLGLEAHLASAAERERVEEALPGVTGKDLSLPVDKVPGALRRLLAAIF
ncbi:MAG: glycosyltransferase [Pseudorhodobacter sp.]